MILETDQIKELILNPYNKDLINKAREHHKLVNMHVTGEGLDAYIKQVKNYENQDQYDLRKAYARSNKSICANVLHPLHYVFNARGGARYYNLTEKLEKQFKVILSDLKGVSVTKWNEKFWLRKRITDPSGLVFIEVSEDGSIVYPTVKSIMSIYDYKLTDQKPEYVIFEPEEVEINGVTKEKYRVIDDLNDYIFYRNGDDIIMSEDERLDNYFEYVPARLISSQIEENHGYAISFIHNAIELLNEVIDDNSIKNIFKKELGMPQYWEVQRRCPKCSGTGYIKGNVCPSCDATGVRLKRDITDITLVKPGSDGEQNITPPAGYVFPDPAILESMNSDLDMLEKAFHYTIWGTHAVENTKEETATGRFIDIEQVYIKLSGISTEAQLMEEFMVNTIGRYYYGTGYVGATILYGKRFQLESADAILTKFADMKNKNVPENILINKYLEYLQAEYSSDSMEMTKQIKLFYLDPFPLYNSKDLYELGMPLNEIYRKILYLEFIKTLQDSDIIFTPKEKLIEKRETYYNKNIVKLKIKEDEKAI